MKGALLAVQVSASLLTGPIASATDFEEARSDSSGLGIAIVKRILDLHESRITVVSQVDTGTRFEFELPLCDQAA